MPARVEVDFAERGSDRVIRAWQAQDAAIVGTTAALRSQSVINARSVAELRRRRDAQAADTAAGRDAARVVESLVTPQQAYLRRIRELKALLEQGKLTQDQYRGAVEKLQQTYLQDSGIAAKRAATQAALDKATAERKKKLEQETAAIAAEAAAKEAKARATAARITVDSLGPLGRYREGLRELRAVQSLLDSDTYSARVRKLKDEFLGATGATSRMTAATAEFRRLTQSTITPLQQHQQRLEQLDLLLKRKRITETQHADAVRKSTAEMREQEKAAKRLAGQKFDGMLMSVRAIGAALLGGGIVAGLNKWIAANNRIIEQGGEIEQKFAPLFKKFEVQTGLTGPDAEAANSRVLDIAEVRRVRAEDAFAGATELSSYGIGNDELLDSQNGTLNALLKGMRATNLVSKGGSVDARQLAQAVASYLEAQNQAKTSDNVKRVLGEIYALFKDTSLQLSDLNDFARMSAVARDRLSTAEQMAVFSRLKDVIGSASEASTSFRQVIGRMQTAAASDTQRAALRDIGLDASDIDLVGEDFITALGRIEDGLQKVAEADRAPILKRLFEEQGVPAVLALMGQNQGGVKVRDELAARVKRAESVDEKQFEADVARGESGPDSAAAVLDVQRQRALLKRGGADVALTATALETQLMEWSVAPHSIAAAMTAYEKSIGLGAERLTALNSALAVAGAIDAGGAEDILRRVELSKQAVRRDGPIDQLPNIGTDAENSGNSRAIKRLGFLPAARADEVRRLTQELVDDIAPITKGLADPRAAFDYEFAQRVTGPADSLPAGGIETQAANVLRETVTPRLNPSRDTELQQKLWSQFEATLARLEQLGRDRAAEGQQRAAAMQREQLDEQRKQTSELQRIREQTRPAPANVSPLLPPAGNSVPHAAALSRGARPS